MLQSDASNIAFCIGSVVRSPETGAFRFVFATEDAEVSADLTVSLLEEKGLAWLRFVAVDRVLDANGVTAQAVEQWVASHRDDVWRAALKAT